jgi:hypothetical protein
MLAILPAGGVAPQSAAWAIDAAYLFLSAYSLEASLRRKPGEDADGRVFDRDEIIERLRMLPASRFPNTVAHAQELTAGEGQERFDFALGLLSEGSPRPHRKAGVESHPSGGAVAALADGDVAAPEGKDAERHQGGGDAGERDQLPGVQASAWQPG